MMLWAMLIKVSNAFTCRDYVESLQSNQGICRYLKEYLDIRNLSFSFHLFPKLRDDFSILPQITRKY